jgi:hypothetical protein
LLVGDAGAEFARDRERMHPEPLLDEAAVPERMQTLARATPCVDVIAAPVVPGRSMQGLVDVADPEAREAMIELVHGRTARRELDGTRTYDRCAGVSYLDGADISEVMVQRGLARTVPGTARDAMPRPKVRPSPKIATIGRMYALPRYCRPR